MTEQPDNDESLIDSTTSGQGEGLGDTYVNLTNLKGASNLADIASDISKSVFGSPQMNSLKSTIENIASHGLENESFTNSALDLQNEYAQRAAETNREIQDWIENLEPDTSPQETAQNTAEMLQATLQLVSLTDTLGKLTQTNLEQARRSEQRALASERRSTRIAWVSAGGSIAAVLVAAATLATTIFLR